MLAIYDNDDDDDDNDDDDNNNRPYSETLVVFIPFLECLSLWVFNVLTLYLCSFYS